MEIIFIRIQDSGLDECWRDGKFFFFWGGCQSVERVVLMERGKRRNRAERISKTAGRIRTKPSSFERGHPGGSIGMYHLFLFDDLRGCSSV